MPAAIIRDRFSGDRMARLQSLISVIFMIVPMAAPTLGQAILLVADWRWIFAFMGLMAAAVLLWSLLRLPETLDPDYRQPIHCAGDRRQHGPRAGDARIRSAMCWPVR